MIPITLDLNAGTSVDALTFGMQINANGGAPPLTGSLGFTKDASITDTPFVSTGGTANSISVVWSSLNPALSGTKTVGVVTGTIPGGATNGQSYTLTVTGASGALTAIPVVLSPGPDGNLAVVNISYAVGDVSPYTNDIAPNFGDSNHNILDLIQVLFAVNNVPGFKPAACSDRLDAMDLYPPDTCASSPCIGPVTTRGGDGVLDIRDLIRELFRVNNLDQDRPVRITRGGVCGPTAARNYEPGVRVWPDAKGALVFGEPETSGNSEERIPVYLDARRDLARVALTFALGDQRSQLRFVAAPDTPPSLANDNLTGVLALAWMDGVTVRAGERLLLGYVAGPRGVVANLTAFGLSASSLDDSSEVRLNGPDTLRTR